MALYGLSIDTLESQKWKATNDELALLSSVLCLFKQNSSL